MGEQLFLDEGGTDAAGFDAFYAATSRRLLGQLVVLCGDPQEAQDCLQEAYLRAWQRWSKVAGLDDPAAWVHTVAWRLAIDRWRRAQNGLRAWRRHGGPANMQDAGPDRTALMAALRRLPASQREAVVLHHLVGMSVEQIAAHKGSPAGTVKARLSRGRARLATLLSEGGSR